MSRSAEFQLKAGTALGLLQCALPFQRTALHCAVSSPTSEGNLRSARRRGGEAARGESTGVGGRQRVWQSLVRPPGGKVERIILPPVSQRPKAAAMCLQGVQPLCCSNSNALKESGQDAHPQSRFAATTALRCSTGPGSSGGRWERPSPVMRSRVRVLL